MERAWVSEPTGWSPAKQLIDMNKEQTDSVSK